MYKNHKIPSQFDGYKVLQISDLHDKLFGKAQKRLMKKIRAVKPDVIVITGDLVDSYSVYAASFNLRFDNAMSLIEQLMTLAPVFYVPGNHEARGDIYKELQPKLIAAGVHVLFDSYEVIKKGNQQIGICGLRDASFGRNPPFKDLLTSFVLHSEVPFNILLAHDPSPFQIYDTEGIDLVFCGHFHGGQVRLPCYGAVFTQFPYIGGAYEFEHMTMVVSRGLGSPGALPLRLFNLPELVVVTLKSV
jgi:predicted MPP superfamily phosphohydrolase